MSEKPNNYICYGGSIKRASSFALTKVQNCSRLKVGFSFVLLTSRPATPTVNANPVLPLTPPLIAFNCRQWRSPSKI